MLPQQTPLRLQRAHASITPIFDFLRKYGGWLAEAREDACDFALGNPQTIPIPQFVQALQDALPPLNPAWYAYKTNEAPARAAVCASLRTLTGLEFPPENVFLTNGATGAHLVVMNALIGPDDEVVYSNPPWFFTRAGS